ncbi:hypothetical protein Spb1_33310 [Planctopirus ephydatiae]|jgi:hypothetical protein|uniref:Uncharacterized protein n=1 Tax=Planctopirus ephydatiae TaxID=2528019 RepID=A0A518GS18_9PLAN|nr:hypothetical protein Spb1_33310 [Planctopirus ephydatiae]
MFAPGAPGGVGGFVEEPGGLVDGRNNWACAIEREFGFSIPSKASVTPASARQANASTTTRGDQPASQLLANCATVIEWGLEWMEDNWLNCLCVLVMDLSAPAEGSGCGPSGGFAQTLLIVAIYDEIRQWETIAGTGKSAPVCSVFSGNIEIGGRERGVNLFAEFPFLPDWFIPRFSW